MLTATVSGRIAGVSKSEISPQNGAIAIFTVFGRPKGLDDVPVTCRVQGKRAEMLIDAIDTDIYISCTGGIKPQISPDGRQSIFMEVSQYELCGFADAGEVLEGSGL